jgi:transposase
LRLAGNTARQANSGEINDLRAEALALMQLVADLPVETRLLKKTARDWGMVHAPPLVHGHVECE